MTALSKREMSSILANRQQADSSKSIDQGTASSERGEATRGVEEEVPHWTGHGVFWQGLSSWAGPKKSSRLSEWVERTFR